MRQVDYKNGYWKRYLIFAIDYLVIAYFLSAIDSLLHGVLLNAIWLYILLFVLLLALMAYSGGTIGQRIFKLHTVDGETFGRPTFIRCVLREIISLTGLSGIGLIVTMFRGYYWDKITNIKVVDKNKDEDVIKTNTTIDKSLKINKCPKCKEAVSFDEEFQCTNCGEKFWQSKEKFDAR